MFRIMFVRVRLLRVINRCLLLRIVRMFVSYTVVSVHVCVSVLLMCLCLLLFVALRLRIIVLLLRLLNIIANNMITTGIFGTAMIITIMIYGSFPAVYVSVPVHVYVLLLRMMLFVCVVLLLFLFEFVPRCFFLFFLSVAKLCVRVVLCCAAVACLSSVCCFALPHS